MYFIWNRRVGDGRDTIPVLSAEPPRKPADVAVKDWPADDGPAEDSLLDPLDHNRDKRATSPTLEDEP